MRGNGVSPPGVGAETVCGPWAQPTRVDAKSASASGRNFITQAFWSFTFLRRISSNSSGVSLARISLNCER